jgi:hypothetical protein
MAARRLIVVMLVLLGLSTIVAALVPAPQNSGNGPGPVGRGQATRPKPPTETGAVKPAGFTSARIEVSRGAPPVVRVRPGERLVLLVGGRVGDDISIPAFGLTETMTPTAPARFDLIVDRSGRFAVRAFSADRVVGRIVSAAHSRRTQG